MSGLPRVLENFNVFADGQNFACVAKSVTLPKIAKKTEDYRGSGMLGDVAISVGLEKMELEVNYGGFDPRLYSQLSVCGTSDLPVRYVGVYTTPNTCIPMAVEIYMRGEGHEVDPGTAELGKLSEFKMKYGLTYYRLNVDGVTVVELDFINGINIINGVNLAAAVLAALGL